MTLSRIAMALILAVPATASAQSGSVEEALARHRATIAAVAEERCADETNPLQPDEIVVCGRKSQQGNRLPLPTEPTAGARVAGTLPSATDALKPETCSAVGPHQSCASMIPILPILVRAVELAGKAVAKLAEDD